MTMRVTWRLMSESIILTVFRNVKHYIHYIVDAFHHRNHKCSKQKLTVPQKRRCSRVRTNMSESFSAWIRPLSFFVNSLRPHSHAFWIEEACVVYNTNLAPMPTFAARLCGDVAVSKLA